MRSGVQLFEYTICQGKRQAPICVYFGFFHCFQPLAGSEGAVLEKTRFTMARIWSIITSEQDSKFSQEGFAMSDLDYTRRFNISRTEEWETRQILSMVYAALQEKGYNPINQIVGYILSEDPTYITNYNNARTLIRKIDRDELLQVLVKKYLEQ